jgi:hypothetical protein
MPSGIIQRLGGTLDIYNDIEADFSTTIGFPAKIDFLIGDVIKAPVVHGFSRTAQLTAIYDFFRSVIKVTRVAASRELSPQIARFLFGMSADRFGFEYHQSLPEELLHAPRFFRTDEPNLGQIAEIQSPGSMWGEYLLLLKFFAKEEFRLALSRIEQAFNQLAEEPIIHHMLDNSSRPLQMMYFIQAMRKHTDDVKFFGFDDVKDTECNIIRSHSFFGLAGQNLFLNRLELAREQKLVFDYPPTPIFDQKVIYALPFLRETASFFTDSVRSFFIPTFLIDENLSYVEEGSERTLGDLLARPRSKRRYFLKYAGQDTNRNWGSRDILMLWTVANETKDKLLNQVSKDINKGEPWVLQPFRPCREVVDYYDRKTGQKAPPTEIYAKYSSFGTQFGFIGCVGNYRNHPKVHGQRETIYSIIDGQKWDSP